MRKLSDEQAGYFAGTDSVDHFGLVALDPQDPEEIIAVVRYARKPGMNEPSTRRSWRTVGRARG
jgi:hypothetical protein